MTSGLSAKALILVVEDEVVLRMAATLFLEDAGFEVIEAPNADVAISFLESRNDIQLVFTDVDMPLGSMNGLKLAHAVRHRWPPISIIVVSGHRTLETGELPAGGRFFAKPYAEEVVVNTMREMLDAA